MYGGRMSGPSSIQQQSCSQWQSDIQHSKISRNLLVTLLLGMLVVMVCTSLPFTSLRPLPPPRSDVWAARGVPLAARGGGVPLASRRERSARSRSARSAMVLCWRTAEEPNWAKNYALGDQCNEANSIPCSCILFDTIPASICVFGCHLQTRFYQWVQHIRLFSNQRTSVLVCIPSAGSKSTHLWYLQDRDPKLVRSEIRNWNVHLGGSNINFTRNDQTKCPDKWNQISIAGLPIVKPQPQLFNIVSTKWHRPIQQNGSKWSKP